MLLINKSKREIAGIKPGEKKELSKEEAEKLLSMYGEEFFSAKLEDEKLSKEIEELKAKNTYLESKLDKKGERNNTPLPLNGTGCDEDLLDLREKYSIKFSQEVPVNKKNDKNWISSKIES